MCFMYRKKTMLKTTFNFSSLPICFFGDFVAAEKTLHFYAFYKHFPRDERE